MKKQKKISSGQRVRWALGITLICGCAAMLYVHRRVIAAAIRGEELPRCPHRCCGIETEDGHV